MDYAYVSQQLQAFGIKKAIEWHRRDKPKCYGTLFWQLNDCWPVISWSAIDYYGSPKALYHVAKRAFKNVILPMETENDSLKIFLVSDSALDFDARLSVSLFDRQKQYQLCDSLITAENQSSKTIKSIALDKLPDFKLETSLLYANLITGKKVLTEGFYFFRNPKNLRLPSAQPEINLVRKNKRYFLEISSEDIIYALQLFDKDGAVRFSENDFHMYPGQKKLVEIIHPDAGKFTLKQLKYNSLNQVQHRN